MSCACGNGAGTGAGTGVGVPQTLGPRGSVAYEYGITHGQPGHAGYAVGLNAAESFADARAKSQHAHDLANNSNSVGEYLQAANYAAQAAHEASDLDPGSQVVSGYAAAADLAYNQIAAGGSTMNLSDANLAAVAGIEAADSAIAQAEADVPVPEPVKPPPPGPTPGGTTASGASATTTAAVVVAVVAAGVAGYYGWRYLKKSRRRAGAPRRRRR